MPFTLSHAAAILPFRPLGIPLSALVAGSMAPDVPYFLPLSIGGLTHSRWGVVTIDLLIGVIMLVTWWVLLRPVVMDLAPRRVRHLMGARVVEARWRWTFGTVVGSLVGIVVGAFTHVLWDSFTHPGRFGVERVDWLEESYSDIAGHELAQHVSTVLGLGILAIAVWRHARLRLPAPVQPHQPELRPLALLALAIGVVVGVVGALSEADNPYRSLAFNLVTQTIAGAVVGLGMTAVLWHVRQRMRAFSATR